MFALLLALSPQVLSPADVPFGLTLPPQFEEFVPGGVEGEWIATSPAGATFRITHRLLDTIGASPELVARRQVREVWAPMLAAVPHRLQPWDGEWAGAGAAGNEIEVTIEEQDWAILERVQVLGDHLLTGSWVGPAKGRREASEALATFAPPPDWRAAEAIDEDPGRGLGAGSRPLAFPGVLDLEVDTTQRKQRLFVNLRFEPAPGYVEAEAEPSGTLRFVLPGGEIRAVKPSEDGAYELRYPIDYDGDFDRALGHGLAVYEDCMAALDGAWTWVALPPIAALDRDDPPALAAPAWRLRVRVHSHETALSAFLADSEELQKHGSSGSRVLQFPAVASGRSWPFFLVGLYVPQEAHGRMVHVRKGAKASYPDEPVRFLDAVSRRFREWLPSATGEWRIATFPRLGDRNLLGLLLLDEDRDWLSKPLDSRYGGRTRRTGLAELAAGRVFGVQLPALGTGSPFLTASLAEYAAWRLLEAEGRSEEAAELLLSWQDHEAAAGELSVPLSLLPVSDLAGAQRLLSRGALVWRAIEQRAGRETLDTVLEDQLASRKPWTTETLRAALEARTGSDDWLSFFRLHVYGRAAP